VRAAAYRQCSGYEALRLTVLDDVKLGQLLVRTGKRRRAFLGVDEVECPWGTTVWSMVKLLEKNNFAALDFRLGLALAGSVAGILIFAVIVLGLMAGTAAGLADALSPLMLILPASILARRAGWPRPCAVFVLFMVPVFLYAMALSASVYGRRSNDFKIARTCSRFAASSGTKGSAMDSPHSPRCAQAHLSPWITLAALSPTLKIPPS
jgi:hypothetical protein